MIDRNNAATDVLLDALADDPDGRRALVVDDPTGRVPFALRARGASVQSWFRRGTAATPWPPPGEADLVTLRLPREKDYFEMALHAAAARLVPGGRLWVYGANDEGVRSAGKAIGALFPRLDVAQARKHCRVWSAERPAEVPGLRGHLQAWRRKVAIRLPSGERDWVSYPGTFAKGALDPATAALLEVLPPLGAGAHALDFACGTGVVAAELLARATQATVDMLDHDALAVEAARENAPRARAWLGDGWSALPEGRYDLIASNPPIHAGKERSLAVLETLVGQAPEWLAPHGALWLVTQRQVPLQRLAPGAALRWEDGRFRVWRVEA